MKTSFWTYFTSGFGTLWLVLYVVALITRTHIDTGLYGLIGFPLIALIYAWIRRSNDATIHEAEAAHLLPRMAEFLEIHPEYLNASQRFRDAAFHKWLKTSPEGLKNLRRENASHHKDYNQFRLEHPELEKMSSKERHDRFREWLQSRV